jgi:hypothetical protein
MAAGVESQGASKFKTRDVRPGSWKYPRDSRTLGDLKRNRIWEICAQTSLHVAFLASASPNSCSTFAISRST